MKSFTVAAVIAAVSQALLDFDDLPNIDLDMFEEKKFDNLVDHFNFLDERTYEQRYWISDQFYD